jgi:hypothetical protein
VILDSFWAVPRTSGPVFMFCAPELVFDRTEGVGSRYHVLIFWIRLGRYRRRRVSFSCFALSDSFWAIPRASGPVFMFCASRLFWGCTESDRSRFHVLRSRTHFRLYRVRRVPFSYFAHTNSYVLSGDLVTSNDLS